MQILNPEDVRLRNNYEGIVEEINDPLKAGRVKVRIFGIHTEDKKLLPTNNLPWSIVALPTISASISGIGYTHGLLQGSLVIGYFRDSSKQDFIVTHSIPTIPSQKANPNKGFNDPQGKYPTEANIPDVNSLARESYPYNKVYQSASGHLMEFDDTPENERVSINHRTGSGIGVDKEGNVLLKSKTLKVISENGYVHQIKGDMTIDASGDIILNGSNVRLNPSFGVNRSEFNEVNNFFKKNILEVSNSEALLEENPDNNVSSEQVDSGSEGSVCYLGEEENPYDYAFEQIDLDWTEKPSSNRNENIAGLWREIGYNPEEYDDQVAWCAVFVGAVLKRSKLKYLKTASSRAYASFGEEIKSTFVPLPNQFFTEEQIRLEHLKSKLQNASKGDILVFDRGNGFGHVGFYSGDFDATSGSFSCLGGNQGNTLKVSYYTIFQKAMILTDIRRSSTCRTTEITLPEGCEVPSIINDFDNFQIFVRNLYFEARSESDEGIIAVGHVVLNRSKDTQYYNDTNDFGSVIRKNLQFSWYNKGQSTRTEIPSDIASWNRCCSLAKGIISGEILDNTDGSVMYYSRLGKTSSVEVSDRNFIQGATIYTNRVVFVKQIGNHRFFKFAG